MSRRFHYLAPITTDRLNSLTGANVYVGPQAKKVLSVTAAMQGQGISCFAVSTWVPNWPRGRRRVVRERGVPIVVLPVMGKGVVKRLTAAIATAGYALRHVRRGDVVLLYNFYLEYALCAVIARLKGARAVVDIEDGPRTDGDLRERINQISFVVMHALCDRRYVIASSLLAPLGKGHPTLVVRGTADFYAGPPPARFSGERIRVLFGGSLMPDNGTQLFTAALRLLRDRGHLGLFEFLVSGYLSDNTLKATLDDIAGHPEARIKITTSLTIAEYDRLLEGVDVGLSLKLPDSGWGQTTLPSKVIEYISNGVLVVATRSGDLDTFLGTDAANLLDHPTPEALADALMGVATSREAAKARAFAGQEIGRRLFSRGGVGKDLTGFLFDIPISAEP